MVKVKQVEVEVQNLSEAACSLFVEGYNTLKVQLPKRQQNLAWGLHKAQIKAWRTQKRDLDRRAYAKA